MRALRGVLYGLLASWAACASAGSTLNLPFKPIIFQAIDSPVGKAQGTYGADEQWVKIIRSRLGSDGPVTVTATVVKRWKQEGCARVETKFNFHDARFDDAKRAFVDSAFTMQLNTCRDGQPPVETMDLRDVKDNLSTEPEVPVTKLPRKSSAQQSIPAPASGKAASK